MKKFFMIVSLFIVSVSLFAFSGCSDKDDTLTNDGSSSGGSSNSGSSTGSSSSSSSSSGNSSVSSDKLFLITPEVKLYDYDVTNHTSTGTEIENKTIKVGERYKLVFDFDFTNKEAIVGNGSVTTTINITLGDYENEDNKAHLTSDNKVDGGLGYSSKSGGSWESSFVISKSGGLPDFTQSYFIVGIDSLGSGSTLQPVKVNFSATGYGFSISGVQTYTLSLATIKGDLDFSESDIIKQIGSGAAKNNVLISVPIQSAQVDITFYENNSKESQYGVKTYTSESFTENKLYIDLSIVMNEYLGEELFYNKLLAGDFSVYLKIVVKGSNNYNDAIVEKLVTLE